MLRVLERCRLCISGHLVPADSSRFDDAQPFGIGSHEPILDAIVDHLDKVTRPRWPTVQPSLFGSRRLPCPTRASRGSLNTGSEGREDRLKQPQRFVRATGHEAVPALLTPHPAAGPTVDIGDASPLKRVRPTDVLVIVRIAAIHDHVAGAEQRNQLGQDSVHGSGRHHQPDGSRWRQYSNEIRQVLRADRSR